MLAVGLHGQLLEVGGEALQVLVVGHDADGLGAEEVPVPHGQQPHQHRQVALQRSGPEMLVHDPEAGQHLGEPVRADRQHRGQPDGRVHRVPAAHPVPEAEHVGGVDAELSTSLAFVDTATKCRATAASSPSSLTTQFRAEVALVIVSSVLNVLDEMMNSVSSAAEIPGRLHEVGGVHVGDEPEGHVPVGVVAERLVGHHRAEVGAADADVDHVADPLAGVAGPRSRTHPVGEVGHPVEHLVHLRHDVLAVHHQRRARGACAAPRAARPGPRRR